MNAMTIFSRPTAQAVALILAGVLATGATVARANPEDPVSNPNTLEYPSVIMDLPDYDEPFQRDGVMSQPELFRTIGPGMSEAQVQDLLGAPLSTREGRRGTEWDYNFTFVLPASQHHMVCQYKVVFDGAQQVTESVWRRHQCLDIVNKAAQ